MILEYFSISFSNGYSSVVDKATTILENTATLIDHVWFYKEYYAHDAGIVLSSVSDHLPCIFSISLNNVDNDDVYVKVEYRNKCSVNNENFKGDLHNCDDQNYVNERY